ncbi:MAG: sugar phosphate isomerase/epimerase [Armatimonadetes bacterium]|nr:sugar phosphate isomerase/epimerase [Armatimonadota bacterium]
MRAVQRRDLLTGAVGAGLVGLFDVATRAADPPKRSGKPVVKTGIAAYSYRGRLTGKDKPAMTMHEFVSIAATTGWDGVELTSYYVPVPVTGAYLADLKRHCFIHGLQVSASSVGNVFTHPAGEARDREIEKVKTWLGHSQALGAPVLRVFAGNTQAGQTPEQAERCCIECLEACCDRAAETGVMLGLENHGGIVAESEGVLRILKAVKSDWCGANLDTGNFRTDDPYTDIARCAPHAVTTHLKTEVTPRGGAKQPADVKRIVKILADSGYRGYLTLEYEGSEPVEAAAPRVLAAMREAIALIA